MLTPVILYGKVFGYIREDNAFIKYVDKKEHFFRKFNGWGINSSLLMTLHQRKCKKIILIVKDDDAQYMLTTAPETFLEKGIDYRYKNYEPQKILHIFNFERS